MNSIDISSYAHNYYIVKLILHKGKKENFSSFYMSGADFVKFVDSVNRGAFGLCDFYEIHLREVK